MTECSQFVGTALLIEKKKCGFWRNGADQISGGNLAAQQQEADGPWWTWKKQIGDWKLQVLYTEASKDTLTGNQAKKKMCFLIHKDSTAGIYFD